jgi:hypothetical protein
MTSRRDILKAFAGAVASVAIGLRVAHGMPQLPERDECPMDVIPMTVNIKTTDGFGIADWRVAYGSLNVST